MKKITITLAILGVLGVCLPVVGQPWDGGGVEGDPYLIYTAEDMNSIGLDPNYWDAHFKLMANINLGGYTGTSFADYAEKYSREKAQAPLERGKFLTGQGKRVGVKRLTGILERL